jgi:polynucleotide 5'-hydroxyl-kinase GRC3/NOL9
MLSAVAARKAALAQSRNTSTDALPTLAADVASSGSKSSHTTAKPPSVQKRKSSASIPQSTSRPKKPKSKSDGFASEENDKAVLQNTWSRDCAVEDSMQVDHDLIPRPHEPPAPSAVALTGKRQWSPSRPVDGFSSSDDDDNVDHSADHSAFPLAIPPPPHAIEEAIVLSTFTPVEGQNTFGLEQEELEVLYGSSSSSALNVAIVILRPRETLCLLGTYQLSVLRGSITIDGTILTPSRESHHVFAPRSSPLPIIRHRSMEEIALVEVDGVPARISRKAGKDDVLLAFRELRTGVEALGSVLPRFSGVFQRESRDSSFSTDANDLRLSGAHLVRPIWPCA